MVRPAVGRRAGGRWGKCRREAPGDERCIARHRQQRLDTECRCPIEPGEHAGKRALAAERSIRQDRHSETGKPRRIAIGADRDDVPVRSERRDDARQHRSAADIQQRLVLTLHSPRATTGEDQSSNLVRHHAQYTATANGLSGRIKNVISADKIRFTRSPNACSRRACHRCDSSRLGRARVPLDPFPAGSGRGLTVAACNLASARYGPLGSSDGALSHRQLRPCQLSPERRVMRVAVPNPFAEDPAVPRRETKPSESAGPAADQRRGSLPTPRLRPAARRHRRCRYGRLHPPHGQRRGRHARTMHGLWRNIVGPGIARHGARIYQAHRRWVHGRVLERHPGGVVRGQVPGRGSCLECPPGARNDASSFASA